MASQCWFPASRCKSLWMETSHFQSWWSLLPAAWHLVLGATTMQTAAAVFHCTICWKWYFLPWCARLLWSTAFLQILYNTIQLLLKKTAYVCQSTCLKNVTAVNGSYKYPWLESASFTLHVTHLPWKEFHLQFKKIISNSRISSMDKD